MPSKKKKYNARFPPARIKKIMQKSEEVGKVAAVVPVIVSRTLELFVDSLLTKAANVTRSRQARTLTPAHLKASIMNEPSFQFLMETVASIPDIPVNSEEEGVGDLTPVPYMGNHHPLQLPIQRQISRCRNPPSSLSAPRPTKKSRKEKLNIRQDDDDDEEDDGEETETLDEEDGDAETPTPTTPIGRPSFNPIKLYTNYQMPSCLQSSDPNFSMMQTDPYRLISPPSQSTSPIDLPPPPPLIVGSTGLSKVAVTSNPVANLLPPSAAPVVDDDYDDC